jgi:hypothetical protein
LRQKALINQRLYFQNLFFDVKYSEKIPIRLCDIEKKRR